MKPIKANLKFDKDGLGHDKAKDFTNHWWENAYNDAANNIDIEHKISSGNDAVAISLRNGESIDVSVKFSTLFLSTRIRCILFKMYRFRRTAFQCKKCKKMVFPATAPRFVKCALH